MNKDIKEYNNKQATPDKEICEFLSSEISSNLKGSESKVWHGHPVWFLEGNPIVGYAKRKDNIQLLFWSGQSFDEPGLKSEGSFKASEIRITNIEQINTKDLKNWLKKAAEIQWDYKNIVKRRGKLERLK